MPKIFATTNPEVSEREKRIWSVPEKWLQMGWYFRKMTECCQLKKKIKLLFLEMESGEYTNCLHVRDIIGDTYYEKSK